MFETSNRHIMQLIHLSWFPKVEIITVAFQKSWALIKLPVKQSIMVCWFCIFLVLYGTGLGGTCKSRVIPLSEKIKIEFMCEEEWNYVFKLGVTILIYEYLFAMIIF